MRNKFDNLQEPIYNNIDIFLLFETNTDYSFLTTLFCIDRYSSFDCVNNVFYINVLINIYKQSRSLESSLIFNNDIL